VDLIEVKSLPQNVADIYGGLSLPDCTSGFSVMNPVGIKGITTAGHCQDTESYNGVDLPFMGGTMGGINDIQWNRGDLAFDVRNLIWDGTYARYIYDVKFRADQFVGEWVCRYGKTTGYDCGTIAATDQDGINIRVDNAQVEHGDSGGPWFWNNTAFGTTISIIVYSDGSRASIYGPVDNIYNTLGVIILPAKEYLPIIIK
jgi:hypothetical protein